MSRRIERVNELIQQEVALLVQKEIEAPEVFITIIKADTAEDLNAAKVYFSVFPNEKAEAILKLLQKNTKRLQWFLNRRLKMKFVPEIYFVLDNFSQKNAELEALLNDDDK